MKFKLQFIGVVLIAAPAFAGEYAVLGNGFRIHADRHEAEGAIVRLYEGEGVTQMRAGSIDHFEAEETTPVAVTPAAVKAQAEAPAAQAQPKIPVTPEELAAAAAKKYSLPESFVRSVMKVESGLHQEALSSRGAIGLMQLMPQTAKQLGVDPKNSKENAEGGAQYLRDLLARYEDRPDQVLLALAAYNAGPGAVEKYHGVPPYAETRQYILRVLKYWDQTQKAK
jgi:soluble lytic murein transglycosylase-like protein